MLTEKQELILENSMFLQLNEGAQFFRWFKKYPELENHEDLIRDVETILNKKADVGPKRVIRVILKIFGFYDDVILPLSILAFPIGPLINRLDKYLMDLGQFALVKSEVKDLIRQLERAKNKNPKDKELAKKCDAIIDKLQKHQQNLQEDSILDLF